MSKPGLLRRTHFQWRGYIRERQRAINRDAITTFRERKGAVTRATEPPESRRVFNIYL
jgi:hypothetical protein